MGIKKILKIDNSQSKQEQNVSFTKIEKKDQETKVSLDEAKVYEALENVYDPELPVSIVDLGLIYDVILSGNNVDLKMTLTTPGCGMGAAIAGQAEMAIKNAGADNVIVEIVWDPPWNPDMMSDEARTKLGIE